MSIRIISLDEIFGGYKRLIKSLSDLYDKDPLPPHCYLVYDLFHEIDNTDLVLKLSGGEIVSYVLVWRSPRVYGVHIWRFDKDLLSKIYFPPDRRAFVHVYDEDEKIISLIEERLREIGFSNIERREYYDMTCGEKDFSPSNNESITVRLGVEHVDVFIDLMRSMGREIDYEEAFEILRKRRYYGVIIDDKLVSIASRYLTLDKIHMIGDVYTRPEYRGRGYARAVTSAITREAVSTGALAALHVETSNEPALRVYKRIGYKIVRRNYWLIAYPQ
ncbi:MAG: GNAT family N-acetyltransferase [Desulfurococcales archaeon]|nr:GNAT family N-acetyltransferase [Desulfurococcales archaeon]